jgi:hypothetical protein
MWMFDNLDYYKLDYFSYICKNNKILWMEVRGLMTLMCNFM